MRISIVYGFYEIDAASEIQSTYSSALTADSQTYSHTECQMANYYYEAIQVKVIETGCYTLASDSNIDTFAYIYKDKFNSLKPTINLISKDDDSLNNMQFKLTAHLHASITYVLVVTTSYPNVTGAFSILVSGTNNVSLTQTGEYMYFSVNNQ
jgi:hypothetical protein